jgi:hypothetical protein
MTHLAQCKRIVIDDSNHPWGLHQIKRSIGVLPQRSLTFESAKSVDFIRHVIHAVLTAVIASKLQIEELEISYQYGWLYQDHQYTVKLTVSWRMLVSIRKIWSRESSFLPTLDQ